nr:hypothetical protein Iba_chr02bCG18130 [Ipomoea batatas]
MLEIGNRAISFLQFGLDRFNFCSFCCLGLRNGWGCTQAEACFKKTLFGPRALGCSFALLLLAAWGKGTPWFYTWALSAGGLPRLQGRSEQGLGVDPSEFGVWRGSTLACFAFALCDYVAVRRKIVLDEHLDPTQEKVEKQLQNEKEATRETHVENTVKGVSFAPELNDVGVARNSGESGKITTNPNLDQSKSGNNVNNGANELNNVAIPKQTVTDNKGTPSVCGNAQVNLMNNPGPSTVNNGGRGKGIPVPTPGQQHNAPLGSGKGVWNQGAAPLTGGGQAQRGRNMSREGQRKNTRSQSNGSKQPRGRGLNQSQSQKQNQHPNAARTGQPQHNNVGEQAKAAKQQQEGASGTNKGKGKVGDEGVVGGETYEKFEDPLENEGVMYDTEGKSPLDLGAMEKQAGKGLGVVSSDGSDEEDYATRIYGKIWNNFDELGKIEDLEEGELEKMDKANLDPGEGAPSESDKKDVDYEASIEESEPEDENNEQEERVREVKTKVDRENKTLNLSPRQTRSQKRVEKLAKRGEVDELSIELRFVKEGWVLVSYALMGTAWGTAHELENDQYFCIRLL